MNKREVRETNAKGNGRDRGTGKGRRIAPAPTGWQRLTWLGPGFLWMVSAAGSGELLFTPRVGALYGYTLIWALIGAVVLKWFINREIGRYTVCTGDTLLDGFTKLPGPRNWAVWLILVPQFLVAIATIAGLAGGAATALVLVLPGDIRLWMIASVLTATALVLWGRYRGVERVATAIAVVLALSAVIAAAGVLPNLGALAGGVVPQIPEDVQISEILPWLGFMLSGAAGMIWYSYWIKAKGYGASTAVPGPEEELDATRLSRNARARLQGWLTQMTFDNTIAVVGTLIITMAFLVLGTELLGAQNLVPEEDRVAEVLGRLLGDIWGPVGFWFMIVAVYIGFWDTILSDQDGFGRMFGNGIRLLFKAPNVKGRWTDEPFLKDAFVVVVVTILPIILYLIRGEPVNLLQIAGAIEAAHIPILTGLILYLNHQRLPKDLRPSGFSFVMTVIAGLFFAAFSVVYLFQLI